MNNESKTANNFFELSNAKRNELRALVKVFQFGTFDLNINLYRHLIDAFASKTAMGNKELNAKESQLLSHLAVKATAQARFSGETTASPIIKREFDREDVQIMIELLQNKIIHCDNTRDNGEFNVETMVDMKLAL